jgi:hypothetical protein
VHDAAFYQVPVASSIPVGIFKSSALSFHPKIVGTPTAVMLTFRLASEMVAGDSVEVQSSTLNPALCTSKP